MHSRASQKFKQERSYGIRDLTIVPITKRDLGVKFRVKQQPTSFARLDRKTGFRRAFQFNI